VQLTRRRAGEVLRFVVAGGANTLATLLLFQLLVTWVHPQIAYLAAWIAGLLVVILVYPAFVYRRPVRRVVGRVAMGACYLFTYLISAALLQLMTQRFGMPARLAIFVTIIFSMATNYIALAVVTARFGRDTEGSSQALM
jgi:putative flippase GtrA